MISSPDKADASLNEALEQICRNAVLAQAGFEVVVGVARRVVARHAPFVRELDWEMHEAGLELAHSFFAHPNFRDKLSQACAGATGARSFRKRLFAVLRWCLIDLHRKTPNGKAGRRVVDRLKKDPRFAERVNSQWAHVEYVDGQWGGEEERLVAVAADFQFTPVLYNTDRRDSPIISNDDLGELLARLLESAEGAVPLGTLTRVVAERTGIGAIPTFVEVDPTLVSQDEIPMGEILEVDEEAEALIAELSQRQRHILCNYELSTAKLAEQLGVSTSTISNERQALKKVLQPYGEGDGDNRVVVRAVELLDERAGQGGLV